MWHPAWGICVGASVVKITNILKSGCQGVKIITIFAATAGILSFGTAHAQTLEEELRALIQTNPRIEEQRAILRRAQESVNTARSGYLPTISLSGSAGGEIVSNPTTRGTNHDNELVRFNALGIEIRQYLYDGGLTMNSVDSAIMARDSVTYALESTVQNVMLQGISAYLNVLRLNELIRVARARERTIREQAKLETERVERGAGIEVDVLQAKSRLQLAIEQRVDFEGQLRQAMSDYILSFNREPDITQMRLQPSPAEFVPATLEDALFTARENNPLLIGREFIARSARFTVEAQRAGYFPTIDVVGRVDHESNLGGTRNLTKTSALLIEMSWEIFSGFATDAQVASAQETLLEQLAAGDRTVREVERQVRQAWTKLENTQERKALLLNAVSIAQEVFVARSKLRAAGKETTLNVLDAENEVFQAEQNLIRADYDTRVAVYELAAAMGLLSPAMLGLDVEVIEDKEFYLSADGTVDVLEPDQRVEAYRERLEALEPEPLYTPPPPTPTVNEEVPADDAAVEETPTEEAPSVIESPPTTGSAPQPAPEPEPLSAAPEGAGATVDTAAIPSADPQVVPESEELTGEELQDAVRAALNSDAAPAAEPLTEGASDSVSGEASPTIPGPEAVTAEAEAIQSEAAQADTAFEEAIVAAPSFATAPEDLSTSELPAADLPHSIAEPLPEESISALSVGSVEEGGIVEDVRTEEEFVEVEENGEEIVALDGGDVQSPSDAPSFVEDFLSLFNSNTSAGSADSVQAEAFSEGVEVIAEDEDDALSLASGPESELEPALESVDAMSDEIVDLEQVAEVPVSTLVEAPQSTAMPGPTTTSVPVSTQTLAPMIVSGEDMILDPPPAPVPTPMAVSVPENVPAPTIAPAPVAVAVPTPVPTVLPQQAPPPEPLVSNAAAQSLEAEESPLVEMVEMVETDRVQSAQLPEPAVLLDPTPVEAAPVSGFTTTASSVLEVDESFTVFQGGASQDDAFDVPGTLLFGGAVPPR